MMTSLRRCALRSSVRMCSSSSTVDIAFKPNEDGWGYNKNYGKSFDRIFGKKTPQAAAEAVSQYADKVAASQAAKEKEN